MEIFLTSLFEQTDIYLLIIVRLLGFFVIMPIFGGTNVPNIPKLGLSMIIAGIILSTQTIEIVYYDSVIAYAILIAKELIVGIILGFTVYLTMAVLYLAGQLIDFQIGFSMVSVFDPVSQIQVPVTGNLYYFFVSAIMVITGAHFTIFKALFYSYTAIPIGTSALISNEVITLFFNMLTSYFIISVKIAMPIMGAILVLDAALGIMTKTAPQLNIFSIGIPLKMIFGLWLIWSTSDMLMSVSDFLFNEIYTNLFNMIKGLMS